MSAEGAPARAGSPAAATVELALAWRSDEGCHTDVLVAEGVSLAEGWPSPAGHESPTGHGSRAGHESPAGDGSRAGDESRAGEGSPAGREGPAACDWPVSHRETWRPAPGQWLPAWSAARLVRLAAHRFAGSPFDGGTARPRAGRFYPPAALRRVDGGSDEGGQPFRVVEVGADDWLADFNHPLAERAPAVTVTVLDVHRGGAERSAPSARPSRGASGVHAAREGGGEPLAAALARLAGDGPGMQARWRGRPTDFWSDGPFERADARPDPEFYTAPRLVQHIDAAAIGQVAGLYGRLLPRGGRILDLMSSWVSHLPADLAPAAVTGLGMNRRELEANPQLTARVVHDLNRDPALPFPADAFDAAVCTVSIDYLVRPFDVFAEIARVLRPGGRFVVTFSNRWFPPKVVGVWEQCHELERMGVVLEYFLRSGRYAELETRSIRGLPRPADDEYAGQVPWADPVYAVWGTVT